jgi:NADPH-dependent 2,4-dienoyl-CoA reductase/sulfur reductase-like enzyme
VIAIIGAGPAGLAAAISAAQSGQHVLVLDSAPRMGGQFWRHRDFVKGYRSEKAVEIFESFRKSNSVSHISGASVWSVEKSQDGFLINYLKNGKEECAHCEKLIIATGGYDRALPFPGWDTPGSITAGGAQAMLKGQSLVVGEKIVVAGTGPFLLPVATGLAEAGAQIVGIYEANNPLRWALSPFALLLNLSKFGEFLHYRKLMRRHGIALHFGKIATSFVEGEVSISKVRTRSGGQIIAADAIATGWGFMPDLTIPGIVGCNQKVDRFGNVYCESNWEQRSSINNVWVAGESTGIGGADLALVEGAIAGLSATGARIELRLLLRRWRLRIFAKALQRSYPVPKNWTSWLKPETTICRCEEVPYQSIEDSIRELGAKDSRGVKLFTRCGMGLCQGRTCSRNVSEIVQQITGAEISDAERLAYSNRPVAAPIPLGILGDGKKN